MREILKSLFYLITAFFRYKNEYRANNCKMSGIIEDGSSSSRRKAFTF